jgi:NADH-quinone oxidoreductase subunit G
VLATALERARALLATASKPVALVSSWASNEELQRFRQTLGARLKAYVKADHQPLPGEVLEDDVLIQPDKNPNTRAALALFPALPADPRAAFAADTDLVLVWGEGFSFADLPPKAAIVYLNAWLQPENGHADVFLPISVQTERDGHYTNCQGTVSSFEACFKKPPGVSDADELFTALAMQPEAVIEANTK